ncbi:MAG TPA: alpha/beta hydrolase [Polyangiaceae bacterium]
MKAPGNVVRSSGHGTNVLLIHGTGTDGSSWLPLMRLLRDRAHLTSYDRRGTTAWPLGDATERITVEEHADDAAELILDLEMGPAHVCGASFGGAVALELARRRPDLVLSATLYEPVVPASENLPAVPTGLVADFEKLLALRKGEEAAALFHRRVLTDEVWEALAPESRRKAESTWRHVHADLVAGATYRLAASELGRVEVRTLLLQGGRSRRTFEPSVRVLHASLPHSERAVIPSAGHHLSGDAWAELASVIAEFVRV